MKAITIGKIVIGAGRSDDGKWMRDGKLLPLLWAGRLGCGWPYLKIGGWMVVLAARWAERDATP